MEREELNEIKPKKEYRVEGILSIPFVTYVDAKNSRDAELIVQGLELTDLLLDAKDDVETVGISRVEEVER